MFGCLKYDTNRNEIDKLFLSIYLPFLSYLTYFIWSDFIFYFLLIYILMKLYYYVFTL